MPSRERLADAGMCASGGGCPGVVRSVSHRWEGEEARCSDRPSARATRPSRGRHPCGPRSMVPRGVSVAWGSGLPGGRRAPSLEVSVPHAPQSARELALPGAWLVHVCGHADLADCPGRPPVSEVC